MSRLIGLGFVAVDAATTLAMLLQSSLAAAFTATMVTMSLGIAALSWIVTSCSAPERFWNFDDFVYPTGSQSIPPKHSTGDSKTD